jgi:hypothetical protein
MRPAEVPDSKSQFLSYNFSYSVFPQTAADKQADVVEESYGSPRQAGFQPPLYLKCGPLLRFTGIYRKPRKDEPWSRDGMKIWEGSVMVATVDAMSTYMKPPTLCLFKQPVNLQTSEAQKRAPSGHQLAAEFADPLTGQFKMSRVGKPLYVKPVGSLQERRDLSCDDVFGENREPIVDPVSVRRWQLGPRRPIMWRTISPTPLGFKNHSIPSSRCSCLQLVSSSTGLAGGGMGARE